MLADSCAQRPGRQLVAWLSLADIMQAVFFIGSEFVDSGDRATGEPGSPCWFMGLFGLFAALSTFIWTAAISLFVFLSVARVGISAGRGDQNEHRARERRRDSFALAIFHVFSWGYPFAMCAVVWTSVSSLASADDTWCYIPQAYQTLRIFTTYLPLFVCWLFVAVMYALSTIKLRSVRRFSRDSRLHGEVQTKLILIPLAFVILRLPGAIFRLIEFAGGVEVEWLLPIMAAGNASQGIADCLVYVVFTAKCRECFWNLVHGRSKARSDYAPIS
jgi:Slime mold cyclic AMP receptor